MVPTVSAERWGNRAPATKVTTRGKGDQKASLSLSFVPIVTALRGHRNRSCVTIQQDRNLALMGELAGCATEQVSMSGAGRADSEHVKALFSGRRGQCGRWAPSDNL